MRTILFPIFFMIILSIQAYSQQSDLESQKSLSFAADVYASHSHLLPYKGYQDELNATIYLKYSNFILVPFIRGVNSQYYLSEGILSNANYTSDTRTAIGAGLDLNINKYVKIRYVSDKVTNKFTSSNTSQDSFGLVYNQYLSFGAFDINNYLESFYITTAGSNAPDTFARIQILKGFTLNEAKTSSHVVFPLLQLKVKKNDNVLFGVSGNNSSAGLGYKYFNKTSEVSSLALVVEAHSLMHQSADFNSDWNQAFVALQYLFN